MPKKKIIGNHLKFYNDHIAGREMPRAGLCSCSRNDYISEDLLELFTPPEAPLLSFWASEKKGYSDCYKFNKLRQTIVLFMAAINNEL